MLSAAGIGEADCAAAGVMEPDLWERMARVDLAWARLDAMPGVLPWDRRAQVSVVQRWQAEAWRWAVACTFPPDLQMSCRVYASAYLLLSGAG